MTVVSRRVRHAHLRSCPSRAFSFLPNKRPIEDLIPFFLGALWRESWLLLALPSPRLSGSREADKLLQNTKEGKCLFGATSKRYIRLVNFTKTWKEEQVDFGNNFLPFCSPFPLRILKYGFLILRALSLKSFSRKISFYSRWFFFFIFHTTSNWARNISGLINYMLDYLLLFSTWPFIYFFLGVLLKF